VQVANAMLKNSKAGQGPVSDEHIPTKYAAALGRFGHLASD